MNEKPQSITGKLGRDSGRRLRGVAGTLLAIALILFAAIRLLRPAPAPEAAAEEKPSRLEPVAGTGLNRVWLTARAAERLGIQTAALREESVVRTLIVGGEVVALPEAEGAQAAKVWVRLFLTESDLNAVDRVQIAHILSLDDEEDSDEDDELMGEADEGPFDDDEDEAETLYYLVDNAEQRLVAGQRVFVKLFLSGSGSVRKFIPYAAVIYDLQGETWVYTNPEPLVFVRHAIDIDYIEGDLAVLSDGPPAGTLVVTVGVAELYGADTGVGK